MKKLYSFISTFVSTLGTSVRIFIGVILCISIYMLPAGIAFLRGRENTAAIAVLNLFLGWTLVGWVAALVWSIKSTRPQVINVYVNGEGKN